MKNFVIIGLILFLPALALAQTATFNQVNDKGSFQSYQAQNGDLVNIGDTLTLGQSSSDLGYMYITQGSQRMHSSHAGKDVVVADIKSFGSKKRGYKVFLQFKGYGLPVNIDYDNAITSGEIVKSGAIDSDQAMKKLKKAKEMLDLGLIKNEEYEALKAELTPIIMKQ